MWNFDWLLPVETDSSAADEWLNADAVFQFDGVEDDLRMPIASTTASSSPAATINTPSSTILSASSSPASAQGLIHSPLQSDPSSSTPASISDLPVFPQLSLSQFNALSAIPALSHLDFKQDIPSTPAPSADPYTTKTGEKAVVDDKRRRNTAASARFRAKKKLREMALENTAKEMMAKAEMLERRLSEYEMEIKWLRQVVTEQFPRKTLREIYAENNVTFIESSPAAGSGVEQTVAGNFTPILPAPTH
ncbi:hypothetical protein HDU97_003501 [Phlyctochytrium planicorne]|nr:hypothetical protein HDU97_003501 [Phlyctochytrium planicorne]